MCINLGMPPIRSAEIQVGTHEYKCGAHQYKMVDTAIKMDEESTQRIGPGVALRDRDLGRLNSRGILVLQHGGGKRMSLAADIHQVCEGASCKHSNRLH